MRGYHGICFITLSITLVIWNVESYIEFFIKNGMHCPCLSELLHFISLLFRFIFQHKVKIKICMEPKTAIVSTTWKELNFFWMFSWKNVLYFKALFRWIFFETSTLCPHVLQDNRCWIITVKQFREFFRHLVYSWRKLYVFVVLHSSSLTSKIQ